MTHRFTGHDPASGTDTGGVPWAGRTLSGTGFDHDDGSADEQVSVLLAQVPDRDASVAASQDGGLREVEEHAISLVAAIAASRLIVPIVAVPGEIDTSSGIPIDATSDMASVTLRAPDGQQALPAFTSTAALVAWNSEARPVPVTAQRAAQAAIQEGCEVIPLDLPGEPGPAAYTLRPSMVWALAMDRPWVPAHRDEHVQSAVRAAIAGIPVITGHELAGTADGGLEIVLALQPGLSAQQLQELLQQVGAQLATDGETRARIDALTFRVVTG